MKPLFYLFVLISWGTSLCAQFTPAPTVPVDTTILFAELAERMNVIGEAVPQEFHEKFAEINQERFEELQEGIRDSVFLFHPDLQDFLDGLMEEIVEANNLKVAPLILIRRSQSPNAASLGNGVFTVNLGLFQSLATQDQIAFVLCHEMAHNEMAHLQESMLEYCERDNKLQSVKKQIARRWIKKSRRQSLVLDARQSVYGSYRLKRENELEADSLGLKYYSALSFSKAAIAAALVNLSSSDQLNLEGVDFANLLQTQNYPVKEKWLEAPVQMFDGSFGSDDVPDDFWQRDSIATHPEMVARQAGMSVLLALIKEEDLTEEQLHNFGVVVDQEMIRAQTEGGIPGLAIVNGLKLLAKSPENATYQALLGEALLATYTSIENHDFDEAVPPEPYFEDRNARLAIRMFRQMRKSELRKLSLAWIQERAPGTDEDEMSALLKKAEAYFTGLD